MDDFENKELDGEQAVQEDAVNSQEADNADDALLKELEEIRDMFQEAIDNASQEEEEEEEKKEEEHGELIQELEDLSNHDEADEEEHEDLPLCECCNEAPVSTLYGEGYAYCDSCRELMKHYPLRISGIIALVAMIAVFGLSAYFGMGSLEDALVVLDARTSAAENRMMSTVQTLYSFTSSKETDSKKAKKLLIDGFIRTGYLSNAKEAIEKYYTEDELNRASNKKYRKIADFTDSFLATRDAVQNIVSGAFSGEKFDCDELIAKLELEKEKFLDEEKGIKYNGALIEYYKYELLRLSGSELEKQLEVLEKIREEDKDGLAEWIYLPSICEVAGKMGNKELAEECFEKMKQTNAEDMKAYNNFALYYRYLETPDPEAIIALCEEAEKYAYEGDTTYYPTLAVAYLLKGEGALALETMGQYMSSNYYTVSNCNLYAVCALYCGDTDVYNNMKATLAQSGFELSELVEQYKDKKITLNDVLADMRGDIG